MFGCAFVVSVPASSEALIVPELAYTLLAITLLALTSPVTSKLVNVPTEVIFGCAFVVNVPVTSEALIVPELAYTLPITILPVPVISVILVILPTDKLPAIVTKLLVLLNVNAITEFALPSSLNTTPVLGPGITILAVMLPTRLP